MPMERVEKIFRQLQESEISPAEQADGDIFSCVYVWIPLKLIRVSFFGGKVFL